MELRGSFGHSCCGVCCDFSTVAEADEAHAYFGRFARWALREFLSEAASAVDQARAAPLLSALDCALSCPVSC